LGTLVVVLVFRPGSDTRPTPRFVCSRFIANKLLLSPGSHSSPSDTRVEWAFAFDVAVNAFFTFFLWIYVGQLLFVGLITRRSVGVPSSGVCCWRCPLTTRCRLLILDAQQLGLSLARQLALPACERPVHLHHLPRLRRPALPPADRATPRTAAANPRRLHPLGTLPAC
jgi:hypothetical protein